MLSDDSLCFPMTPMIPDRFERFETFETYDMVVWGLGIWLRTGLRTPPTRRRLDSVYTISGRHQSRDLRESPGFSGGVRIVTIDKGHSKNPSALHAPGGDPGPGLFIATNGQFF